MEVRRIKNYLLTGDQAHVAINQLPRRLPASSHRHDFHEVFWIRSGNCLHMINGAEQPLQPGHLVFIKPDDAHRFQAIGEESTLVNVILTNQYVRNLQRRYADTIHGNAFWHGARVPPVHTLSVEAMESAGSSAHALGQAAHDILMLDYLMLLLFNATKSTRGVREHIVAPHWLQIALSRASKPEVFRRGAAGLVDAAGKGHEHVCRMTKRYYGKTPSELVNGYRCEYAARQLAESSVPISEISEVCGFDSPSHFYRLFKGFYSQTPRQYRMIRQCSIV